MQSQNIIFANTTVPINRLTPSVVIVFSLLCIVCFPFNEEHLFLFSGRVRIAHVPNVLHLLNAKITMQAAFEKRKSGTAAMPTSKSVFPQAENTESHTIVQTIPKGGHRVAHRPSTVGNIFKVIKRHYKVKLMNNFKCIGLSQRVSRTPMHPLILFLCI
jgi:hypothetical protein